MGGGERVPIISPPEGQGPTEPPHLPQATGRATWQPCRLTWDPRNFPGFPPCPSLTQGVQAPRRAGETTVPPGSHWPDQGPGQSLQALHKETCGHPGINDRDPAMGQSPSLIPGGRDTCSLGVRTDPRGPARPEAESCWVRGGRSWAAHGHWVLSFLCCHLGARGPGVGCPGWGSRQGQPHTHPHSAMKQEVGKPIALGLPP